MTPHAAALARKRGEEYQRLLEFIARTNPTDDQTGRP